MGISRVNREFIWEPVVTPMGRTVDDIIFVLRTLWNSRIMSKRDRGVSRKDFDNRLFEKANNA